MRSKSRDKGRVLKEAFGCSNRAVALPYPMLLSGAMCRPKFKKSMELWVGCIAGDLSDYEYADKLAKAGFENVDIEPTACLQY
jgi:arsenite methyltransferase